MILYIDTTKPTGLVISIVSKQKQLTREFKKSPTAENFPEFLKKFLESRKLSFAQISKIAVNIGPGYFSKIRTGVVAANALAYVLNIDIIPVMGEPDFNKIIRQKGRKIVKPEYDSKPNITLSKKRW